MGAQAGTPQRTAQRTWNIIMPGCSGWKWMLAMPCMSLASVVVEPAQQ
jgi:hypothetical protein